MYETKFQTIAIQAQQDCSTIGEAVQAFKVSCNICTTRGINFDGSCKACPIRAYHDQTVAVINDLREYDQMKAARNCNIVETQPVQIQGGVQ
jgi:hypothetical protein